MDKIKEDMASTGAYNNAGSGSVAGTRDESGVYPEKKKLRIIAPMLKRKGQ